MIFLVVEYNHLNKSLPDKNRGFKDISQAKKYCESRGRGQWMLGDRYYERRNRSGDLVQSFTITHE